MTILVVTQYFWPENFRINDLCIALTERGHKVVVLTGKPNYPAGKFYPGYGFFSSPKEIWNDIEIYRSPLMPRGKGGGVRLMLNYFSFSFFSACRGLFVHQKFDKILVYEPSPVTVGLPAILMKWRKKAPVFFWVQDLWPQSVVAAGGVKNKHVVSTLDRLTRWIYKNCDKILVQSEGFRKIIESQGVPSEKIVFYPNSVESLFKVCKPNIETMSSLPAGFKIMFAGNIGESQDFETIVEAARIVAKVNPDIKWIILGKGRKYSYVHSKIEELGLAGQMFLLGAHPVDTMPDFFACADCLLVSLKRDYIFSLTIPSKIQSYLACGKPILASLDGEGAKIIRQAAAGFAVDAESPEQLAEQVLRFYNITTEEREAMGASGRKYFEENFERELLVSRLEQIFERDE